MSGQRNVNNKKPFFVISAIIFLIVLIAVDGVLIWKEKTHYREKLDILVQMTESKGSMDTAAELLKGKETFGMEGSVLESYGYDAEKENNYRKSYEQNRGYICLGSVVVYLLFLIWMFWEKHREKIREKEILRELEWILGNFQKGEMFKPEPDAPKELEGILQKMESLGNTLAIWKEESRREKEGVKSLVTDISHQLKTPVAALKTCFEILQQENLSKEEKEEFFTRCLQQIKALESLMKSLIQISRMESGMISIRKEEANIFSTLVNAVNRVYMKAEEKQIEIALEAEEELQEMVLPHDKEWLGEAFVNLLENAVKYSQNGTNITMRLQKGISFLRIEVEDEGIGIPKEEYHKIFQRFYRGHSQEVKKEEGTGVGLYLTREIISRHQGTVFVSSKEKGSIFVVQLPYV